MNPGDSDDEDEDRENLVGEIEDSGFIFSRITYGFKNCFPL